MKEIEEREHVYLGTNGIPVRWHDGKLEYADYGKGWMVDGGHDAFMRGEVLVVDPLTGEFVGPPKQERPYDLTTGQMLSALKDDGVAYESRCPAGPILVWIEDNRLCYSVNGHKEDDFQSMSPDFMWRKVEK